MIDIDAERHDRARVACILLGEPEPPTLDDRRHLAIQRGTVRFASQPDRHGFDHGSILAKTEAGERYRAYVADCRKNAASNSSPDVRIP